MPWCFCTASVQWWSEIFQRAWGPVLCLYLIEVGSAYLEKFISDWCASVQEWTRLPIDNFSMKIQSACGMSCFVTSPFLRRTPTSWQMSLFGLNVSWGAFTQFSRADLSLQSMVGKYLVLGRLASEIGQVMWLTNVGHLLTHFHIPKG